MYYIFNSSNVCIGICNDKPDTTDLKTRSEMAIKSDNVMDIASAVLNNGIVVKKADTALTEDEIKTNKIAVLDAEYQPKFTAVTQAYLNALTAGDTTIATARQADYATLKSAYKTALEAIS